MSGFAMHSFGLPRSGGQSEAARRMAEAGMRYQRAKEAAQVPVPPKPPLVVVSPRDEVQKAALEAKEKLEREMARKVRLIQAALNSFNADDAKSFPDPVPKSQLLAARVAGIKADACRIFDVTPVDLISSRRCAEVWIARQYAAQRIRDETPMSMPQIGRTLGGRDHSTIVHACRPEARAKVLAWLERAAEITGGAR